MERRAVDSSKIQTNFLRAMQCCRSLPYPAGKATAENPAGSGFLPRKLKRCPRKATARSANQLVATLRRNLYQLRNKQQNLYKRAMKKG
ncbi:hypothetical protein GH741_15895 [Aquibacillus halophilus]|uniref:Uncharacterized protein n=1 Tax=Aquibacillus halophilus TaxID=930132 RepID=A0A6A8DEV5_9BACI|nr:hypothetical protein [Aquibacillus halophilus]MRH44124.1 hypothetical protein [Aquibacillus halophilus]